MINSNLLWKYHTEYICHKISKSIRIIAKILHYVPRRVLLSIYNSLNRPLLILWYLCLGKLCLDISKKYRKFTKTGLMPYLFQ